MKRFGKDVLAPLAIIFCAAPLVEFLSLWIVIVGLISLAWHRGGEFGAPPLPSRPVKLVLLMGSCGLVWAEFGALAAPEALASVIFAFATLFFGSPVRFYEYFLLSVLCALLLLLHQALAPSLTGFAHMTIGLFFVTALLIAAASPQGSSAAAVLKKNAVLYLQALPAALCLMLVFPRFNGRLGELFGSRSATRLGFSDDLAPGDVAKLAHDGSVAFRARFPVGRPPAPRDLYWRGTVLWDTDGFNWYNSFSIPETKIVTRAEAEIVQDIVIQPHAKRFLFALDAPLGAQPKDPDGRIANLDGRLLQNRDVLFLPFAYRASSAPRPSWPAGVFPVGNGGAQDAETLSDSWRKRALHLPKSFDAEASRLARSWAETASSPGDVVARALKHFENGGFSYTLEPNPMAGLGTFLFDEKRGFCEHYAAAFASLMRAAGIPARVVTGYQGAEYDPWGGYWLVRQSEAHAWSEVWIDGGGWVRVDPTSVVAPERLETGNLSSWLGRTGWWWDSYRAGALTWDGFRFRVELAVFGGGGDFPALFDFAEIARGPAYRRALAGLAFAVLILMAGFFASRFWNPFLTRSRSAREEEVSRHYARLCAVLKRRGWGRLPWEGPLDYARRLDAALTRAAPALREGLASYARLRFGSGGVEADALKRFKRLTRQAAKEGRKALPHSSSSPFKNPFA